MRRRSVRCLRNIWVYDKIEKTEGIIDTMINKAVEKHRRKKSLRWSMVRRLVFGWFLPLFLMILVVILLMTKKVLSQVEQTILASVEKTVDIMEYQLKDCEKASKDASYQAVIMEHYKTYRENRNATKFEIDLKKYLTGQYGYDDNCRAAMLVILENPEISAYSLNYSKYPERETERHPI